MVVAEPPSGVPVLHTGDARYKMILTSSSNSVQYDYINHLCSDPLSPSRLVDEMHQNPVLQRLVGRAILVLDTTYCNPQVWIVTE